jgi:hypothetical protein
METLLEEYTRDGVVDVNGDVGYRLIVERDLTGRLMVLLVTDEEIQPCQENMARTVFNLKDRTHLSYCRFIDLVYNSTQDVNSHELVNNDYTGLITVVKRSSLVMVLNVGSLLSAEEPGTDPGPLISHTRSMLFGTIDTVAVLRLIPN